MNHKNVLKITDLKSNTDLVDPLSGYDLIFLNDFMIDANIGVYKHEKLKRQPLRINVIAKVKNPKTINDSRLQSVVCYNQISKKIFRQSVANFTTVRMSYMTSLISHVTRTSFFTGVTLAITYSLNSIDYTI